LVKVSMNRENYEQILLLLGVLGLMMIFIPISIVVYTIGWIILMATTLLYVASTLVAPHYRGIRYVYRYAIMMAVIVVIVAIFTLITIYIAPQLVR